MDPEREEVEQIPWTMLAEQLEGGRQRSVLSIVLAVVAAVVAGVVAINVLRRPSGTVLELSPSADTTELTVTIPAEAEPQAASDSLPAATTAAATTEAATPPQPGLYSEADLMAVVPDQAGSHAVAAAAEWFVADYFTVLGSDDVVRLAADGLPVPDPGDAGYSWAEWVRTTAIDPLGEGRYDVTVLFRTVHRNEGGALVRAQVRSAVVEIAVDGDGAPTIVGLPRLLAAPRLAVSAGGAIGTPPDDVAATALRRAAAFGAEAQVEGGVEREAGWSVVVSVVDASGVRWPVMFDVVEDD